MWDFSVVGTPDVNLCHVMTFVNEECPSADFRTSSHLQSRYQSSLIVGAVSLWFDHLRAHHFVK
jgi:hypothetical protein